MSWIELIDKHPGSFVMIVIAVVVCIIAAAESFSHRGK